jgi:hypothetical protein
LILEKRAMIAAVCSQYSGTREAQPIEATHSAAPPSGRLDAAGDAVEVLWAQNIEGFEDHQRKRSSQNVGLFLDEGTDL